MYCGDIAEMVELVDTHALGACAIGVEVQVLFSAQPDNTLL